MALATGCGSQRAVSVVLNDSGDLWVLGKESSQLPSSAVLVLFRTAGTERSLHGVSTSSRCTSSSISLETITPPDSSSMFQVLAIDVPQRFEAGTVILPRVPGMT